LHAVLQQTPSTQKFDAQSAFAVHACPRFFAHTPAGLPGPAGAAHVPPGQLAELQHTPSTQYGALQVDGYAGAAQEPPSGIGS
jgi:hypothetical protein